MTYNENFNDLSRAQAKKILQSILHDKTHGLFRDSTWEPIQEILYVLHSRNIEYTIKKTEYYHLPESQNSPMPDGKKWYIEVPFGAKGGVFLIHINASFGPSKPGTSDVYDLVATVDYLQ